MAPEEIGDFIGQILVKDPPSSAIVNKGLLGFNHSADSPEDDPR